MACYICHVAQLVLSDTLEEQLCPSACCQPYNAAWFQRSIEWLRYICQSTGSAFEHVGKNHIMAYCCRVTWWQKPRSSCRPSTTWTSYRARILRSLSTMRRLGPCLSTGKMRMAETMSPLKVCAMPMRHRLPRITLFLNALISQLEGSHQGMDASFTKVYKAAVRAFWHTWQVHHCWAVQVQGCLDPQSAVCLQN